MNPNNQIPTTKILFGQAVRNGIKAGIDKMALAVGATLGRGGLMVGIERGFENLIVRDGVTVAKSIYLKDKAQRFGANVLRESAQKTVDQVGDGTTATIILAHAIYTEAEKVVAAGVNPRSLFAEIELDIRNAKDLLKAKAIPVTTVKQKVEIATISAEEDELGILIGETIDKVGKDGVVTIDKSKTGDTYVEHQEGMQWDKGLASPYFINDPATLSATLEDCPVFVTDMDLNNVQAMLPAINDLLKHSRFLAIIAPSFGGDLLPSLVANKMENKFMAICIKAPGYGEEQAKMLEDVAILTGSAFVTKTQGHKLEDVRFDHFGKINRITSDQTSTLVSGGGGKKELIDARIKEIKDNLDKAESDYEKEKLKERLAKLTNGVAVIRVGGHTDIEIKERYERALDAALATREAVKQGIIPGGEIAYLNLIPEMKSKIVKDALKAPFNKLVSNAGFDPGAIYERLLKEPQDTGFDVVDGKTKDMIKSGIIDPVAVPIAALTNATSVALQLLGTDVLVLQDEQKS